MGFLNKKMGNCMVYRNSKGDDSWLFWTSIATGLEGKLTWAWARNLDPKPSVPCNEQQQAGFRTSMDSCGKPNDLESFLGYGFVDMFNMFYKLNEGWVPIVYV